MQYPVNRMSTEAFADWFNRQLKRREWGRSDFHRKSGVSRSTVYSWSTGERVPDPPLCETIAETFGVKPELVMAKAGHLPEYAETDDELKEDLLSMIEAHPLPITSSLVNAVREILALHAEGSAGARQQPGSGREDENRPSQPRSVPEPAR